MALKRRVALGVAVLMVLLVVAILPPRSCLDVEQWGITAAALCSGSRYPVRSTHGESIDRARARLTRRLREHQLADSLRALANAGRGVRSVDGSVVVLYETPLTPDSARAWLRLALGERDRIAAGEPHARIVLALDSRPMPVTRDDAGHRRLAYYAGPRSRRFTNIAGRDTTCFVTLRLSQESRWDVEVTDSDERGAYGAFLGSCGLVGRFGAAGAAALAATGVTFVNERLTSAQRRSTVVPAPTGGRPRLDPQDYWRTGCAKGELDACASLIGLGQEDQSWMGSFRGLSIDRYFLAYLREVEGPEKFQRFWQSPLLGEQALIDAFGRPAAETARAWAHRDYSLPDDDSTDTGAMVLAAVGWLGAALAAAIAIGKYRQASS
jgi:hypothetical protein